MMASLQLTTRTHVPLWPSSWLWVVPCSSGLALTPQPPALGSPALHRAQLGVPQGLLANRCSGGRCAHLHGQLWEEPTYRQTVVPST